VGHSGTIEVVVTGRVAIAGGTAALGDTVSFVTYFAAKNVAGTTAIVTNVSGTNFDQADASQAADTLTIAGNADGTVHVTATQAGVGNGGTIDWTIDTIAYLD
jgi:hypothetical protein